MFLGREELRGKKVRRFIGVRSILFAKFALALLIMALTMLNCVLVAIALKEAFPLMRLLAELRLQSFSYLPQPI